MTEFLKIPEDRLVAKITVDKLLAQLTEQEQLILKLLFLDGYTLEETGRILGETVRDTQLKESGVRYHRDKLLIKCQNLLKEP